LLLKIKWENRPILDNGSTCKITVDGTDFLIQEPTPFLKKWYSKKFNGLAVRYEVGVAIQTGYIVWANRPFPPGEWPDVTIALNDLVYMFDNDERPVTDKGYRRHPCYFDCPWKHFDNQQHCRMKKLIRARHETVNRRFKVFRILKNKFRHPLKKHCDCFHAVANTVQSQLQRRPTWQVRYHERRN
jgi:DDE superfamily endonuclease